MADVDTADDDVLDLNEDDIVEDDDQQQANAQQEQADDEGEDVLSFEGEQEPEPESDLVKHLRKELRRRDQQLAETRKQPQAEEPIIVGPRPKIEDFDYDQERFDQELDAWDERREAKRQQDARVEAGQRQQQQRWQQVQDDYQAKKAALPFADRDAAEATAFAELSEVQQAVIASTAANPALVIYAAGKNPARLAELTSVEDPLKLAYQLGKMESKMTITKRTRPPNPDTPVRGSSVAMGDSAKQIEKLEKEAERTGDRSKIIAFKSAQKQKGNGK